MSLFSTEELLRLGIREINKELRGRKVMMSNKSPLSHSARNPRNVVGEISHIVVHGACVVWENGRVNAGYRLGRDIELLSEGIKVKIKNVKYAII